jgi:hypothetical protein
MFIAAAGNNANDDGNIPALASAFAASLPTGLTVANFTGSNQELATPGYQKFPGGLIIQWVQVTISGPSYTAFTWPIAFPNACFGAVATSNGGGYLNSTPICIPTLTATGGHADCISGSDTPPAFIIGIGW